MTKMGMIPALVLLCLAAAPAQEARTCYVSSAGDDAYDGASPGTPFATLSKAGAVARAGDTIRLKCGDVLYGTFRPSVSGSATTSEAVVNLPGEFEDVHGTLEPYASAVLMRRRDR
jgi:hypothetical protein